MMSAPSFIDDEQLRELHIDLREEVKEELGLK
jgi:aspartyl-tRNA synthetase